MSVHLLIFALSVMTLTVAATTPEKIPYEGVSVDELKEATSGKPLPNPPPAGQYLAGYYGKYFEALDESAPLTLQATAIESYRFVWLRTFHPPIVVRIDMYGGTDARLLAKVLDGAGGYEPGVLIKKIDRPLSESEVIEMRNRFKNSKFNALPSLLKQLGLDGSSWIIERVDSDSYHYVDHWSPEEGPVREIGLKMLELSGLEIDPIY